MYFIRTFRYTTFLKPDQLYIASFPGHSCLQFLIACSICILQAIKNWRREWPGNEARPTRQTQDFHSKLQDNKSGMETLASKLHTDPLSEVGSMVKQLGTSVHRKLAGGQNPLPHHKTVNKNDKKTNLFMVVVLLH